MEKVVTRLRDEVEILRHNIAEEQRQKYEAYVRINKLQDEVNKLKGELDNERSRLL